MARAFVRRASRLNRVYSNISPDGVVIFPPSDEAASLLTTDPPAPTTAGPPPADEHAPAHGTHQPLHGDTTYSASTEQRTMARLSTMLGTSTHTMSVSPSPSFSSSALKVGAFFKGNVMDERRAQRARQALKQVLMHNINAQLSVCNHNLHSAASTVEAAAAALWPV